MDLQPRDYYNRRKSAMELERQSFIDHYKELSEFTRPRRGRFFIQDRNKGIKKYNSIINSKATHALQIATSGMLAGTMSPSRPWFSLEPHDYEMVENAAVKEWLYRVEQIMRTIFNESNFYSAAPQLLTELILFGTGAMSHVEDFQDVARFYAHTVGSYMIAQNDRCEVDTFFREFERPVIAIIKQFGLENVSRAVRTAYDRGNYDAWFPVCHIIEPNDNFHPDSPLARNKAFKSVYYEPGNDGDDRYKYLEIKGFDEFPVYVPRWDLTGEDIYGTDCPGMTALGDIKGLQIEEKRKAQAIDKMVNPPLTGPSSVRNVPISSLPGGVTLYDANDRQALGPLYQVNLQLGELRNDMAAVEDRIDRAFFVDMFLAISSMEGIQPRNQLDLMQRNEERLLQLGPVLERLHGEFLDKLIDRTFNQASRAGILPEPPEALQGHPLRVKYISSLAMAQRAVATQGIDRLAGFAGSLISLGYQGAMDKFDADQALDEYARAIGTPPSLIVPDEVVAERRAAAQQAIEQQRALDAATQMAQAASAAGSVKTDEANLVSGAFQ